MKFNELRDLTDDYWSLPKLSREELEDLLEPEEDVSMLFEKGLLAGREGNQEGALKYFDKIIKSHPKNAEAWWCKAVSHYKLGEKEESLMCLDKAIEFDCRFSDAWYAKGGELRQMGKYDEAIK